jgi:hypothetical protein
MTPAYERLYAEMKRRLERYGRNTRDALWTGMQQAAIAGAYRDCLPLPGVHLNPPSYFKDHLARFEAEVQYYELRYEAERCRPDDADRTWAAFWLQEVSRMTQLTEAYPELYAYFRGGGTDRDLEFFGGDPVVAEKNAGIWSSFIALGRYEQDLEEIFTQLLST